MKRTRLFALVLPVLACTAFVGIYGLFLPTPVAASRCQQECYAEQEACYATCDENYHSETGDSVGTCYSHCDREVDPCFYWSYWCEAPYESHCYHYDMYDTYEWDYFWEEWVWTDHYFQIYEIGNAHCS